MSRLRLAKVSTPSNPPAGTGEVFYSQTLSPSQPAFIEEDGTVLRLWDGWTNVIKAADESVASSTAVQNDDELFFTATSGAVYQVELWLVYANAAGAAPDLKIDLGEDATARGAFESIGLSTADAAAATQFLANQTATATFGTAATKRMASISGNHAGNGGTFRLRWAQNTSNGTATIVYAGSLLRYRRVF
jgi:hypothetical protein